MVHGLNQDCNDPSHDTLEVEVALLREVVRMLDATAQPRKPWMQHSPCDDAYKRAIGGAS